MNPMFYWAWIKIHLGLVKDPLWLGFSFGGLFWARFVNGYPEPIVWANKNGTSPSIFHEIMPWNHKPKFISPFVHTQIQLQALLYYVLCMCLVSQDRWVPRSVQCYCFDQEPMWQSRKWIISFQMPLAFLLLWLRFCLWHFLRFLPLKQAKRNH